MTRFRVLAAWVVVCSAPVHEPSAGELLEVSSAEEEFVSRSARPIASALMDRLSRELQSAMREGGPVQAIAVCSERALPLTAEVAGAQPGVSVKRVTSRYRNPANAPDALEEPALQTFESAAAGGTPLPERVVQKVRRGDHVVYRYYQPLRTAGLCLVCHGDPERMPQELRAALQARYPGDRAVGYRDGDFRGAIRVELPAR